MSTRIIGFTGNFNAGDYGGSPANRTWGGNIRAWSASLPMDIIETTGFTDTFETSRGGVFSGSGSASGTLLRGSTGNAPSAFDVRRRDGVTLTLTADTGCTYSGTALLSNINIGVEKRGEASITFDFRFTGTIAETWATS
jgi:hypothetical protein